MQAVNRLSYLFLHTATILNRQLDQALQEQFSIGMAQFKILMILQHRPNIQQRQLAECLGQTEASVSRQIKLLSSTELLRVEINPKSRRQHITLATEKGVKLILDALKVLEQHNLPLFEQLSGEQKQQLEGGLHILHEYICANGKPFACDHPFKHSKEE